MPQVELATGAFPKWERKSPRSSSIMGWRCVAARRTGQMEDLEALGDTLLKMDITKEVDIVITVSRIEIGLAIDYSIERS
jgi:hypothetical protein